MSQSELLDIVCNLLREREKSRLQGPVDFGFSSHWLKYLLEIFLSQSLSVANAIA